MILGHLENEWLYSLMHNKLFIETLLRSNVPSKDKNFLNPIFSTSEELIGLKLPLYRPKDKISKSAKSINPETGTPYTRQQIDDWKNLVAELNKPK